MTSRAESTDLAGALEALLLLAGEPVAVADLARVLELSTEDVESGLADLSGRLETHASGLRLLRVPEGGAQLVTAGAHAEVVERFIKAGMREQLTPAAAETLAIIAYRGPIHRAGVEAIRGVNSSFTLRLLTLRGLVERSPDPGDHRMLLYRVSAEFLRHLGLTRVEELPDYATFRAHEGMTALERSAEATARGEAPPPTTLPT